MVETWTPKKSTVVVSGSGSGMGLAVAERFLNEGWWVVGVDIQTPDDAHFVASERFLPVTADITHRDSLSERLEQALAKLPPLAVLVNAAGIFPTSTLDDYSESLYRRIFDVNVLGSVNIASACASRLRQSGGGSILFFASVDAFAVSSGQLLYSASKAAVVSLVRSLAIELADDRIAVNAVAPGWVETAGTRAGGRIDEAARTIPLGRVAQPDEIADWVYRMTSVRHGYVTGESLFISGGAAVR